MDLTWVLIFLGAGVMLAIGAVEKRVRDVSQTLGALRAQHYELVETAKEIASQLREMADPDPRRLSERDFDH